MASATDMSLSCQRRRVLCRWLLGIVQPNCPSRIDKSLSSTAQVADEKICFIQLIQVWPKPLHSISVSMAWCSILSKAFPKSSFNITISFFEWWQRCKYSKDQAMQSWMVLVLMKSYWFLCTNGRITVGSLFARSFVISLIEPFSKEIGLKSPTCWAPSILGISVMYESFMLCRQTELSWKAKHSAMSLWSSTQLLSDLCALQ